MATLKLTDRAVEGLRAPDPSSRQAHYWDTELHGLGVLVSGVTDAKSWEVQGKLKTGKTRRLTIGPTNVLTRKQAWEEAKIKLAEMYRGGDPKASAKRRAQAAVTVGEVFEDFLTTSSNLAPKTVGMYRAIMRDHLAPWCGRVLREIDADEVQERFQAITRGVAARRTAGQIKGGVSVDGRATANSAMRLFRGLWNHQAERDSDLPRNPVTGRLKKQWHRLDRRTRYIQSERLADFYDAARHLRSDIQRDLVIFGLFTGMREGEASALVWDEVDLPQRMIRIPAGRMKGKKQFDLPISDVVYHLLVVRRAVGRDGPFVFPGNGKSGHCEAFTYALRQIAEVTGISVSPHDLRRTYATVAANSEISPVALKLLIAHSIGSDVTDGYKFLSEMDKRRAAQKVADRLKKLCGIAEPEGVIRLA